MALDSLNLDSPAPAPWFALKVLDSLPDLVSYVLPDHTYRFVNRAYQDWFGIEAAAIEGRTLPEFMGEDSFRLAKPYLDRAFAGEPTVYTAQLPLKYGPPRLVEGRLIPDLDDSGKVCGLFAMIRDVSHRERIEQEMLSALDGIGACFMALDRDGRITFMNRAAERLVSASNGVGEVTREQLYGRRPWDVVPGGHGGVLNRAFDRVTASGAPEAFEFTPPAIPDRILSTRVFPTPNGAIGFSCIDVTDQRHAEEALSRREERLRIALSAAGMTAYEYNGQTGEAWYAENAEQVLGPNESRALCVERAHPEDRGLMQAAYEQLMQTGEPLDFTVRWPSPIEGQWAWMNFQATRVTDTQGGSARMVGVAKDVTRARAAEELLRAANVDLQARVRSEVDDRLQAELDRERFWMLSRDLHAVIAKDGGLRRINAGAWKNVLGYEASELMGERLRSFIHPDDYAATLAEVAKMEHVPMAEFEYRIRHADGSWRWLAWQAIADGPVYYATARDVTDDKAREEQVRRTQKLEALGQLTGGVAHDFNNLLTVIMGALDMVQKRPGDDVLRQQLISAALAAARRGEELNKQLLGFARRQAARQEYFVPRNLIEEMAPLIKGALGEAVTLELHLDGEERGVMADPAQFEVSVLNLVINARDAMPNGGTVQIGVRQAQAGAAHRLSLRSADYLVLEVIDSGTGMSKDVLTHVFEPFFTTKEIGKGSGLGLAQVYGFARQSGGAADIQTEEGRGLTASVYLPISDRPTAAVSPETEQASASPSKRILLVEDDTLVGLVTESMLSDMGHAVTRAEDAASARDALELAEFDLLLTDIRMPGGCNGVQLALEASAARPGLKVLLCSGWTDEDLGAGCAGAGWPLLAKPFDVAGLGRAVRAALGPDQGG